MSVHTPVGPTRQASRALVPVQTVDVVLPAVPGVESAKPVMSAEALAAAANVLAQNSKAPNTRRAYESDWASWVAFCRERNFEPFPATPEQVRLYLTDLTVNGGRRGKPLRPRSAERHLAAIVSTHWAEGLPFNANDPQLVKTLDGIKRTFALAQEGAPALRTVHIRAICATFSHDLRSLRNKAIILLGFAGGFRRSEIAALNVSDFEFSDGVLFVAIRRSKTDQAGKGRFVAIVPGRNPKTCPVAAVRAWLGAASLEHDGDHPAFRPVNRFCKAEFGRLSDRAVDLIVREACAAAGLGREGFSAHSLRAGHVTEALANGASRTSVKRQSGHASDGMLDRYDRGDLVADNSSARLGL